MNLRKSFSYGGIAAVSLTLGIIEGLYNTPCIFKPALVAAPLVSASRGAAEEHREEYGPDLRVCSGIVEGLDHALTIGFGAVKGAGLSALCEGVGFGLGKLLSI